MCNSCIATSVGRRGVMRGGLALAGTSLIGNTFLGHNANAQPARAADTPDAALKLLLDGNARYVANQPRQRDFSANRANTAIGQAPFAAVLDALTRELRQSWPLIKHPVTSSWSASRVTL